MLLSEPATLIGALLLGAEEPACEILLIVI